jgi:hypothetical protein
VMHNPHFTPFCSPPTLPLNNVTVPV